jgi:hypothetical protein
MELKKYFPYPSDRPSKKFYIITNDTIKKYILAKLVMNTSQKDI